MSPTNVATRHAARTLIIEKANAASLKVAATGRPYTMRHIQQCVAIVRRRQLVSNTVLARAGFNGGSKRKGTTFGLGLRLAEMRAVEADNWMKRLVRKRQRADRATDTGRAYKSWEQG